MPTSPAQFSISGSLLTPEIIASLGGGSVAAIEKALRSGVEEYSIGSRSLKRHQLEQLLKVFAIRQQFRRGRKPGRQQHVRHSKRRGVPTDTKPMSEMETKRSPATLTGQRDGGCFLPE